MLYIIGAEFKQKILKMKEVSVKLNIYNLAGQKQFRGIRSSYCRGAHGFFVFYDITNSESFKNLDDWLKEIENNGQKNALKYLIGTKCDLEDERQITFEEGQKYAEKNGMKFFETSSKNNINICEPFIEMTEDILKTMDLSKIIKKLKLTIK